jgi:ribosome biogenesis protein MAK21
VKRLLQVITLHQPPFICGVLYLIRELEVTFPGLGTLITDPEELDEDDEEVFKDVPEEGTLKLATENAPWKDKNTHPDRKATLAPRPDVYDGRKRDPEHSNADKSCLWELVSSTRPQVWQH